MKAYLRLCVILGAVYLLFAAGLNIFLADRRDELRGIYRVEAKYLIDEINETGSYDLSKYPHLTGVFPDTGSGLYTSDEHYVIIDAGGRLWRAEYDVDDDSGSLIAVNVVLGCIFLLGALMLIYIGRHLIAPFGRLNNVPEELAKGNLAVPIPEERSRFFGRFTWGVNLLRESIEDSRKREIGFQRDKKLLLLSLSHDIKTPLSAIKLNAKALERGLYQDDEKRREAALSISRRADEIESFVSQITQAAGEDFMNFEVKPGEVFLSEVIAKLKGRYSDRLEASHTEFVIAKYEDCILSCDPDRLGECLQNLIENAVKYGDGKRISIDFSRMDGCGLIKVSNTGCTLPESELTQIFESFRRGSNAERSPGNGLGLFICKRLMNLMGGEIYAEINGGCFEVTLVIKMP